ncbi:metallophosphatase family protein [Gracilibacillus caseinilyticus]|uniref:Phosphoesterase n=1 Tax=Gracilibacillus caseinilyticus TaxID=2932256 RepID=A0ABY4EVN1_9BACI|nr:metallophosphoesterase family protein [Gracilibacillus caseinilyticus]UOQ48121.1 metallophosphatase family protein [Gracilibacillus caseinilyticus]
MKIAALYDIHGNLPALNAVLNELKSEKPDLILIGGDIVSGPLPVQTLERLFQLADQDVQFISGNNDREVVMAYDGKPLMHMSEKGRQKQYWVSKQLSRTQRDFLATLDKLKIFSIEELGEILFCHATPKSDKEIFTPLTSKDQLINIFSTVEQQLVVCGHTHIQFQKQLGEVCILNAGSVGMPFANQPGAYWLLLTPKGYEFRRTIYDIEKATKEIETSKDPYTYEFIKNYIQNTIPKERGIQFLEKSKRL